MFSLYADEDSTAGSYAEAARAAGLDWLRAGEAGMLGASDPQQLAFAAGVGRAIFTANRRDFMRLHTEWMEAGRDHAGIIILSKRSLSVRLIFEQLTTLQRQRSRDEMVNAILFISDFEAKD